jgi:hypothetical protein
MAGQAGWYRAPGEEGLLRFWNGTSWTDHRQPIPDPMAEYERQFAPSMDTRSMIDQLSLVLEQRQFEMSSGLSGSRYEPGNSSGSTPEAQVASSALAPAAVLSAPAPTVEAAAAPAPTVAAPAASVAAAPAESESRRKRLVVLVRCMWIGVAILVVGLVATGLASADLFAGPGEAKASGIVTSLGSTADDSCAPIARFAVTGRSYTANAAAVSPCPVGLGQAVDVFYTQANPGADAHISLGGGIMQYLWVIPLLGGVVLIGSLWAFIVGAGSIPAGVALIRDGRKRSKERVA